MKAVGTVYATVLESVQGTLECQIMINIFVIVLVRISTTLFLEFNPLAHVSQLCTNASMQKNRVILEVDYDSHVQHDSLLQRLDLLVIAVEYHAEYDHVHR